jgi:hypothetical protein
MKRNNELHPRFDPPRGSALLLRRNRLPDMMSGRRRLPGEAAVASMLVTLALRQDPVIRPFPPMSENIQYRHLIGPFSTVYNE